LAQENDSPPTAPEVPTASLTRRSRAARPARRSTEIAPRPAPARKAAAPKRRPLRSLATLAIVAGLVAAVGIPAYGALVPEADAKTMQQAAEEGAQSLIVASEVKASVLERDSYSATTEAEIAKKKAAAAAAARAKLMASTASVGSGGGVDLSLVGPGTGPVRWPLATITRIGDGFRSRGGAHHGVDLISPGGTPIFASTDGVVRVSQESYFGYGVAIVIDGVIDGRKVSTTYAHLRYGSRTVGVGSHVKAGQVIGLVGATGRAFGNHLHFEVKINGSLVDPLAFLRSNAG
jgi:murein DD-endopeptidase MepM/ murein hydrolase activator NlpD